MAGLVSVLSVRTSASTTPKTQLTTIVRIRDLELPTASKTTYVNRRLKLHLRPESPETKPSFSPSLGPHSKKGPNVSSSE